MSRVAFFVPVFAMVVASCGTAPGTPDGGESTPDAAEPTPDAGDATPDAGDTTPDAGQPPGNPKDVANGTWHLAGADSDKCGLTLQSGATGVAEPLPSTNGFELRVAALFQGAFSVALQCAVTGDGPAFTCQTWQFSMSQGGCLYSADYRDITGTLTATAAGADATITGTIQAMANGSNCPPNPNCGPSTLAASGTVVRPQ